MKYICPTGIKEVLLKDPELKPEDEILEIKPFRSILTQLQDIQDDEEVICAPDPRWTETEKQQWALDINDHLVNLNVIRNTLGQYMSKWEENAFYNHDRSMQARTVDHLHRIFYHAVVLGAGPSGWNYEGDDEKDIYAAWSARFNFRPEWICHCDAESSNRISLNPSLGVIFTPYCCPQFLTSFTEIGYEMVYLDGGNPISARFAQKRNLPEHNGIVGSVVDMMVQCALYAGHNKISLIGVDFSCRTLEEFDQYRPNTERIETVNYRGEIVYTDPVFLLYQRALEKLVKKHPEVEFTNLSDQGVIIENVPYSPV